ncbi:MULTISPECIES: cation diffusion facilitator family transporter [unclassified Cobetia]|uniref:cation diffusion facilitator family transporter n=1 Tax=unclassified Cobetia TaxID=2609414 RepID=UPI00178CBA76|nr:MULTISPECIES: cation diffusion facilitator family transporter [unclassified Cobetia]MBE2168314.1 cation transporter [Cobetia sp. 2AS1]MDH2445692.1 cation diffusion facilitator family transporter [Cobetia sp. 2AS]
MPQSSPADAASTASAKREAQRITLIGAALDGVLGVAKLVIGKLVGSQALIADGIHSLSDLVTDAFVLVATHYGRQAPDRSHPWGHERIETLGTLVLGSLLLAVAGAIGWEGILRSWELMFGSLTIPLPGALGIGIAIISLLGKEGIFRATLKIARKQKSKLLEANAWHSRSDALSTVAVLIGLIGTQLGASWLDGIAAVVVGVMVGKIGASLAWEASRELIDTALPREQQHAMRECLLSLPEVRGAHDLRSRTLAGRIVLEVHLLVAPRISVSEGHAIGHHAVARLKTEFPQLSDVLYHIDPEDDSHLGQAQPTLKQPLPLRSDIIAALEECWQQSPLWQARSGLTLHYVNHATTSADTDSPAPHVDILLELPGCATQAASETALQCNHDADSRNTSIAEMERLAAGLEWFGKLEIGVMSHIHQR